MLKKVSFAEIYKRQSTIQTQFDSILYVIKIYFIDVSNNLFCFEEEENGKTINVH